MDTKITALAKATIVAASALFVHGTALGEQEIYTDSEGPTKGDFNVDWNAAG